MVDFPPLYPLIDNNEIKSVIEILKSKKVSVYRSDVVSKFEKLFAKKTGVVGAIATNNGTAALHTILLALGVKTGDEVIVQAMNYISAIYGPMYCGAKPIFTDISLDTFCSRPEEIESKITSNTKVIITSTLFGLIDKDIARIKDIAKRNQIFLVEDLSQGYGLKKGNKMYNLTGDVGFYSLSETKNITTSEGGIIISNSKKILNKCAEIINLGQIYKDDGKPVYPSFEMGRPVNHRSMGYSYRMSPILAMVGITQINKTKKIILKRNFVAKLYSEKLKLFKAIVLPTTGLFNPCFNSFPILLKISKNKMNKVIEECLKQKIPIRKTYFTENIKYTILKKLLDINTLKNTDYFDQHNLVLPINISASKKQHQKLLDIFIYILKKQKIC